MILFMGLSIHPQITSYQPYPIMKLYQLLQAYDFDELMPVINDMFPGTSKFRPELKHAYELLLSMQPVASKKPFGTRYYRATLPITRTLEPKILVSMPPGKYV